MYMPFASALLNDIASFTFSASLRPSAGLADTRAGLPCTTAEITFSASLRSSAGLADTRAGLPCTTAENLMLIVSQTLLILPNGCG